MKTMEIWDNENFTRLYNMIFGDKPVEKYMEIGVNKGNSISWQIKHSPNLKKIVCCDNWGGEYGGSGWGNHNHITARLQEEKYPLENIIFLDGSSFKLIPEYFAKNKDEMFDLIFVDGSHSAKGVKTDILNTIDHARVLAVHDIYHPSHPWILNIVRKVYDSKRDKFFLLNDGINTALLVKKF